MPPNTTNLQIQQDPMSPLKFTLPRYTHTTPSCAALSVPQHLPKPRFQIHFSKSVGKHQNTLRVK